VKSCSAVILLTVMLGLCSAAGPVDLVNPFIDTHNSRWFYFSSACRPFGMVSLSPDTDTKTTWSSGYLYGSDRIRCFSHIHAWQMSGVAVMPTTGVFKGHLGMDAYQSKFSHDGEIAKPGYHKVVLDDYGITAELTSTTRVGFHRYTFPASDTSSIIFDTGAFLAHGPTPLSKVWRVSDKEVAGFEVMGKTGRRPKDTRVYFVAQLSKPMKGFITWQVQELKPGSDTIEGNHVGGAALFPTQDKEQVLVKVAISYVSVEQARENLTTELPHWDFGRVKQESFDDWNEWLGRIEVEGGTAQQRTKLYTDLWHSLLGRRIVSDVDGQYLDMTGETPRTRRVQLDEQGRPLYPHYNFDAWWGSHWSLNILWSMLYPEVMDGFCNTMIDMYRDGGLIPRGPSGGNYTYVMIGDPAVSFFATAYNKGIRHYDIAKAYEGLRKNAFVGGIRDHAGYEHNTPAYGGGMSYYVDQGYVPEGIRAKGGHRDGASMTLEYAYQDWCLAQLAQALGHDDDAKLFLDRSQNYRKLWNPATGYIHPKDLEGNWIEKFDPIAKKFNSTGFCEANSAIYTYFVPQDMAGLIGLFGGQETFATRLNRQFEDAQDQGFVTQNKKHASAWVDYSNQPGTAMAHLFNHAQKPWLTQKWVRRVKAALGDVTPYGGYNGDEDQGQMGALGVLMAIGLFQVDGGASVDSQYEITSPIFDKITLHLNKDYYPGDTFVIQTHNNSDENLYIQKAELNGRPWNRWKFPHADFARGGRLDLTLSDQPNTQWGVAP